jgi:hypothetical protein
MAQERTTSGLMWSYLHGLDYEVYAGVNIGGTSPIPLPAEIRQINSYSPDLNMLIGTTVTKWLTNDRKWGIGVGARFEGQGMETRATVKNYGMEIIQDGSRVSGHWTGKVQTNYSSAMLTIPITAVYRLNDKWRFNVGPYLGIRLKGHFNGYVYDGYLREGDPTGNKVTFEGDSQASYDFSDELRRLHFGAQAGASWQAFSHLSVNANLAWGFNDIFKSSFKTVTFNLYPIYLNVGFGYRF